MFYHIRCRLGAILVFLPGYDDISQMREKLESENKLRQGNCQMQAQLFALHSQINSAEQYKVFESVPPNRRKVVRIFLINLLKVFAIILEYYLMGIR